MRKLLTAAAVAAGLFATTTFAGAASPTASYSQTSHGHYALCVTNNTGYPYNVAQVALTGLARQPSGTAPAGWTFVPLQVGSTWTAEWQALDPSLGIAQNATSCSFAFTQHGRPLKSALSVTLTQYDNFGFAIQIPTTALRTN